MADVRGRMADARGRDRAQLFLVGALAVAVLFVSLALLLNTAIYTENLATRNTASDATHAHELRESTNASVAGVVGYANYRENESYDTLWTAVATGVRDVSDGAAVHGAVRGRPVEVSLDSVENGTRITHDVEGPFVDASATPRGSWTVVDGAAGSRDIRLDVSTTNLADGSGLTTVSDYRQSDLFHLDLAESSGSTYEVFVYGDGADTVSVRVIEDDGTPDFVGSTCSATAGADGHVLVSVSRASVDDTACPALSFAEGLGQHDVEMQNATVAGSTQIQGTYELFVDQDVTTVETTAGPYYDETATSQSPYATPAVYTADVALDYRTAALTYDTRVTVDPEAHPRRYGIGRQSWRLSLAGGGGGGGGGDGGGGGNAAPTGSVSISDVTDEGGNRYDIETSWSASDTDGSVASVEVILRDPDGGAVETKSPPLGSSPVTFQDVKITGKNAGAPWTVELVVYDDQGGSTTITHTEDLP